MRQHSLDALELLTRRRYGRRNFLTTFMGGNEQNRRVELADLAKAGKLVIHTPNGNGDITRSYPKYFFRIFEKAQKHPRKAETFWHQVLTDDLLISIETACKKHGLRFTDRDEILKGRPFELPCTITREINGKPHSSTRAVTPDGLFSINNTHFVLEADTGSEPIERVNLEQTSYLRKFLQYRDVLKNKTYEKSWGIPNLMVLNVTTKANRKDNLIKYMREELNMTSRSMLFASYPSLASTIKAPQPILSLLDDPFARAGHDPFIIRKEVI